ncbi:hypothetical protein [Streptomyces sp. LN785]|uniref:hypothetical protein n=1 Tax=Streptomyces sp. LN785 TaxID=3112983 RepID=UPI003714F15C
MSADLQPPVLHALSGGTYLSMSTGTNERDRLRRWSRHRRTTPPQIGGVAIRVIEAPVAVRAADGTTTTTSLRLFTTLLLCTSLEWVTRYVVGMARLHF